MKITISKRAATLLLVGVVLAAGGGIAYATIPSADGTISGCAEKRTGILRVIDAEAGANCLSFEKPIAWNARGPQGLRGDKGDKGDKGDPGAAASRLWARVSNDATLVASSGVTSVTNPFSGVYDVTFDRDVTSCAVLASHEAIVAQQTGIDLAILHDHDDAAMVHVTLTFGSNRVDQAFSIAAFC